MLFNIAWKSLLNRRYSVSLTIASVALSVLILVGMDHIRHQAKASFSRTVSGVDLIVGARTGELNLLLASVFRIGHFTNGVSWDTYHKIAQSPRVAWTIPITLGDSHKGFPVLGTTEAYFEHFAYGNKQPLDFAVGVPFSQAFEVVLGATIAKKLRYQVGDTLTLSHGTGDVSFAEHTDTPFVVVGVLSSTGTPVDDALHVSLASIELIHGEHGHDKDETSSQEHNHEEHDHEEHEEHGEHVHHDEDHDEGHEEDLEHQEQPPEKISAFLVGLKSKLAILQLQYSANQNEEEALSAIVPGVALNQLWELIGFVENLLKFTSILILIASLLGLSTMLLASIEERSRELAIMRAIGATPLTIASLIQLEAVVIALSSSVLAIVLLTFGLTFMQSWLSQEFGLFISTNIINTSTLTLIGLVVLSTMLVSLIPTLAVYKKSLQAGLSVK